MGQFWDILKSAVRLSVCKLETYRGKNQTRCIPVVSMWYPRWKIVSHTTAEDDASKEDLDKN